MGAPQVAGPSSKLTPGSDAKAVYSFKCGKDGKWPRSGLLKGANGEFYGTTEMDGDSGAGTVFSIQK
jgi:uncharacterized repeat protein (TIGR03803 family)